MVWSKSARNEPLSTGPKQLAEDEAGIRRQTALSPYLSDDDDFFFRQILRQAATLRLSVQISYYLVGQL